ncbi:MAG: rhodanese-like domain-containing protein [Actinomycetota bacterium]
MPVEIGVSDLRRLIDEGARLVEVLPAHEYEEEHLPGAINIPLKSLDEGSTAALGPGDPIIVYCWDDQ